MAHKKRALIVGITGLSGRYAAMALKEAGWHITGLARSEGGERLDDRRVAVDLTDRDATIKALSGLDDITDLFLCIWKMHATEADNVRVNRAMLENLFAGLPAAAPVGYCALVTGLKHYLGPFESYATSRPYSPFLESQPRLPVDNFYYAQEDVVFDQAARRGFRWTVHRPHSMIGFALGNAMNMAVTLAVYASICRETGRPFVYPGSAAQYAAVTDVTDARILAKQLVWSASTPEVANIPLNIANGDVFRWHWLWARIAEYFGLEPAEHPGHPVPLQEQMADAGPIWDDMVKKYGLEPWPVNKIASFWHSDADLGREIECFTDMTNSRRLGFTAYQNTVESFTDVFDELRARRIIPA